MQPVRRFVRNTKGADFIVGDINGCFTSFDWLLEEISFSDKTDRVFITGNLLGVGEENHRLRDYLELPGFHAVLGANDYRFIDYWHNHPVDEKTLHRQYPWTEHLARWQLVNLVDRLATHPIAAEVVIDDGVVGVIHGDCSSRSWEDFTRALCEDNDDVERVGKRMTYQAVFGRERYIQRNTTVVQGIKRVYAGHSPVKHPTNYGNVHFIDTGVSMNGNLTAINPESQQVFSVPYIKPRA